MRKKKKRRRKGGKKRKTESTPSLGRSFFFSFSSSELEAPTLAAVALEVV